MKKIFISLIISLFLFIPTSVLASSNLAISCDKSEISVDDTLTCTLSLSIDEGTNYKSIEGNIESSNIESITFNGKDGYTGSISDNKLVVNSTSFSNSDIGSLQIKFSSNGSKSIKISNIKLYDDAGEVTTINDINTTVKVKSSENTLESLAVSECDGCKLSPSFSKRISYYVVNTKSDQIRISAKASGNATVTGTGLKKLTKDNEVFSITVTSEAGTTKTYKISVNKESSDASLESLTIDKGILTPNFSLDTTSYKATVDSDKVVIKAVAKDKKATITGTGEKKLDYGKNEFTIVVKTEEGTSKSYLLTINRPDTRNANAYLENLTIDGEDIGFEKDIIDYTYTVEYDVNELEIEASPELKSSNLEIIGNKNFKVGENIVTIKVTAEDGSEKTYTITVTKNEEVISDIYLDDLEITGYDISFSKEKFDYTITIGNEKKLDIITSANEEYKVEIIGNEDLQDGSILKIIVSDEEENSNIYKIKIKTENANVEEDTVTNSNDMNYIPIIMISLLGILFIVDIVLLVKRIKNK